MKLSKNLEEFKKKLEEKQKQEGLFTDDRWTNTYPGKVVGHINTSYEDELNGLNEMMKSGLFENEWYQEELKIIKERYGIKD